MRAPMRWPQLVVLATLAQSAIGQICAGSISLNTTQDVEALLKCREVEGNVYISPKTPADFDMSGVEVIHGDLTTTDVTEPPYISFNISSSTLTRVGGDVLIRATDSIQNLTLPKLETVGGRFSLNFLNKLTYADITSLHSVGTSFDIRAPRLSTLKHTELRYVGGYGEKDGINVGRNDLENVDSIFNNPIKVNRAFFSAGSRIKRVTIGLNETNELSMDNAWWGENRFEVVLGGRTSSMKLGFVSMVSGISGITRDPGLETLLVDHISCWENKLKHLHLPFDQLRELEVLNEGNLTWLSVPPQATQWANFSMAVRTAPKLNLTSEYMIDDQGKTVRSWYWPEGDMFKVDISKAELLTGFFDSFLKYRENADNTTSPSRIVETFMITPKNRTEFDCRPFEKLADRGLLKAYYCSGVKSGASSIAISSTWILGLACAVALAAYF